MNVYIKSSAAISPQHSFDGAQYLNPLLDLTDLRFNAIEPQYKEYIEPKLLRRMSKIIKMSVATSQQACALANLENPDAILVATGLGCIDDSEKFLKSIFENDEGVLSPTAFIQSTHNTVAGQIALATHCENYNFTYSHHSYSFENALVDAMLLFNEGEKNVLVGAAEEMTDPLFNILTQMGCVSAHSPAGEGAAFFVLTSENEGYPVLNGLATCTLSSQENINNRFMEFLKALEVEPNEIDLVLSNDDRHGLELSEKTPTLNYQRICGAYFTSTAFAMHLASEILAYPNRTEHLNFSKKPVKHILISKNFNQTHHSFILMSI